MPAKTKTPASGGSTASPKRTSVSPTVSKRATPRSAQPDTPKSGGASKRSNVSPLPRSSVTTSPSKAKRTSRASPPALSAAQLSPPGSRRASRRPSATTSPSRRASAGASPSRRQSASLLSPSRRTSLDPLQPERCTVDGQPLSQIRKRHSKSSTVEEQQSLSLPADQFMAALTAMNSEPEMPSRSHSQYPTDDPVPRAPAAEPSVLAQASLTKPAEPERVDELTSMLESIRNEAHIRVSVNDLVAFEYVDQSSHFWRWGLGTIAALPGPRLAQLMLWTASDMADIPSTNCPLTPEEREAAMRELEALRQKREDDEIIVEELNKKLHSLAATYRAERHEYHQEMEMAEHTLREARREVRSLDEKDWRECRSYVNPPDIVEFILSAVVCVLGEHTNSWTDTLRIVRSRDFIVNITDFDPASISPANKRILQRKYLKDKRFTYQNAMNGSRALGALQRWVAAQTATFKASNKLQKFDLSHTNQQEEMTEVQRRLDLFKKALADLDDNEDDLLEKLGDRPERVRFAITPRPTDVAAAQAAAASAASAHGPAGESLHNTRHAWTFTDESLVVLRSSILVNYDTPDSTTVQLTEAQVEQLKDGLQARAAPYVQEKQAENKQRKLEDELTKLRGNMAEAKTELDHLKAAQNEHERALAAKERAIEDLQEQLGMAPPADGKYVNDKDSDDESGLPQEAAYPSEDGQNGGAPADKNQSRALDPDGVAAANAEEGPAAGMDDDAEGGDLAGGPDGVNAADKPTPEAVKALEEALADKEKEINDLKEKLKDAEDAAQAAEEALDAAEEALEAAEEEKKAAAAAAADSTAPDGAKASDTDGKDDDDDGQGSAYPTEDGPDGSREAPGVGAGGADPVSAEAARQKEYQLKSLLDALEKEAKALRKSKDRADRARLYTGKKMAKNAAFVDVMEVQDEEDEDDVPYQEDDAEDAGANADVRAPEEN